MFNPFKRGANNEKNVSADDEYLKTNLPKVNQFVQLFSRDEFRYKPDEISLHVVGIDGDFLTLITLDDHSLRVLPVFTDASLADNFVAKFCPEAKKIVKFPYRSTGFIGAIPMFRSKNISGIVINPCPDCKITNIFSFDSLKTCENLEGCLALNKAVRFNTLIRGLETAYQFFNEHEFQKAGRVLAELEQHNSLIVPELYYSFFVAFSALRVEEQVYATCKEINVYDTNWARDLLGWWPICQNYQTDTIFKVSAAQNEFGIDFFDMRSFTLGKPYLQPDDVMARFFSKCFPDLETVIEMKMSKPFTKNCQLSYPGNGIPIPNGPVFFAPSIYFRWHIYFYQGELYFIEALTNELRIRLKLSETNNQIIATEIEASGELFSPDDPFVIGLADFCIKHHIYNLVVPHPFPAGTTTNGMVQATMQFFGSAGLFGTFVDTASMDTNKLIEIFR